MAMMARLILAVMVAMVAGSSFMGTSLERSAEVRAKKWLADNNNPDEAGMNDLKMSDPSAFAVVQALLAKQQLGLLDPNHPSASFQAGPAHHQRSFAEEAAENGLTSNGAATASEAPAPVALTSTEVSSGSSPYPSVGSAIRDPFSFHPQDKDDEMVQSVLGAVDELKSSGRVGHGASSGSVSSSASLVSSNSYMATQVQQTSQQTAQQTSEQTKPAHMGPWSFDWGNTYAGTSNRGTPVEQAKAQPQPQPEPQPSSSLLTNSQTTSSEITGVLANDAASLGMEQVIQEENKATFKSKDHKAIVPPALSWGNPLSGEASVSSQDGPQAPFPQVAKPPMAMNQHNSYLNGGNGKDYELDMVGTGFHNLAAEWRDMKAGMGLDINKVQERNKIDEGATLGAKYEESLKAARQNAWKVALKNTAWGGDSPDSPKVKTMMLQNHYLMDLN